MGNNLFFFLGGGEGGLPSWQSWSRKDFYSSGATWLIGPKGSRVIVNGLTSGCWPVSSGFPQGSILGIILMNVSINYLDSWHEGVLFSDDTKLGRAVDSLEGEEAFQSGLNKSEGWEITSFMKFKIKFWILHLEWDNSGIYVQNGRWKAGKQPHRKGSKSSRQVQSE